MNTERGKQLAGKILFSSWFLALIPSAVIISLLLPPPGSGYTLDIGQPFKNSGQCGFDDLNSDTISERVVTGKSGPYYFVAAWNLKGQIYDQWNLTDSLNSNISDVFFGNFDHDQYKEIFLFSHSGDSLFLNINEILQPSGFKLKRIFIERIGYWRGEVSAKVSPTGFYDVNGDGFDEVYFKIGSFYNLGTRRMYYYDIANRKLFSSKFCGNIFLESWMSDVDDDGVPEITGNMSGSGNYSRSVQYTDSSTWLMVFDPKLRFKFPPVEFRGFANSMIVNEYRHDDFRGFFLSHEANGADTSVMKSCFMIYTSEGSFVRSRPHSDFVSSGPARAYVFRAGSDSRIIVAGDRLYELNTNLQTVRSVKLPVNKVTRSLAADLQGDGENELILFSEEEKKLAILNSNLHLLAISYFFPPGTDWRISHYLAYDHTNALFVSSEKEGYLLALKKKKIHFLSWLLYPGIYAGLYLFIVFVKLIGTAQLRSRENINNRLITLQLQGIKAQLDPHFTFNTLNSIASLIYLEDRQEAYDYMRKFTQLLRTMLNDAEKIYRNLGDEIEFVNTYLELEKLRFGNKFDFVIETGEDVLLNEQVPKLVLQTFAENAVKHGVMPSESGGLIRIKIEREKDYLKLTVEDNGIGRKNSAGQSSGTGKGLKLTSEFYDILNQINKRPIRYLITDLYADNGKPAGTRVEIWVPLDDFTFRTSS